MHRGIVRRGVCGEPGPYEAHCTLDSAHDYSCYDASEDVSFNSRHEFVHKCENPACHSRRFYNPGD